MTDYCLNYVTRWIDGKPAAPTDVTLNGRPLIVIDPEDREQVERLADACRRSFGWKTGADENDVTQTQAALRSLTAPPKPPEPQGLGAVVEDAEGRRWTNTHRINAWVPQDGGPRGWDSIDVVKILSPGWSE